jgi:alkylhydroperoxidase family enzyme
MSRIRPLTKNEVTPEVRAQLEQVERAFGKPLIPYGIQAYCPPILEASRALGAAPARSHTLPAQLRSLVCLRVAQMVGCPF